MRRRRVTENDIAEALASIAYTHSTPEESTCIVGTTTSGRTLKVWVVGAYWPQDHTLQIKSVAWKDEGR